MVPMRPVAAPTSGLLTEPGGMTNTGGEPSDNSSDPPAPEPAGGSHAPADLLPLVYDQLRDLARHRMAQEQAGHTLQDTALVHEAYMRLAGGGRAKFAGRGHFFHAATEAMRRILIEHARAKGRVKRGGGAGADGPGRPAKRVPLEVLDVLDL